MARRSRKRTRFVVCVGNGGYPASLEPWKIYESIADAGAEAHDLMRIVDESGEDYLHPNGLFVPVHLPQAAVAAVRRAAGADTAPRSAAKR